MAGGPDQGYPADLLYGQSQQQGDYGVSSSNQFAVENSRMAVTASTSAAAAGSASNEQAYANAGHAMARKRVRTEHVSKVLYT